MSLIYNQIREITLFLLDNDIKDIDKLYERLVVNRKKKIPCFRKRKITKINEEETRVRYRDISKNEFKKIIMFMDIINILELETLNLLEDNRQILEDSPKEKFNNFVHEIIKLYFEKCGFVISKLKDEIQRIKYPELRNSNTIHKKLEGLPKIKKMIEISDFRKLLTLLSDIEVLERTRPTLFLK